MWQSYWEWVAGQNSKISMAICEIQQHMMVVVTVIVISRFPVRSARWEMIVFALWEIVWERFQSVVVVFTAFDALIRRDVTFFGNIYFARHYVNVHKRSFGTKIADFPVLFSGEIVRFGALLRRFVENFANYVLSKYRDALGHVKSCFDSCKTLNQSFLPFERQTDGDHKSENNSSKKIRFCESFVPVAANPNSIHTSCQPLPATTC